MPPTGRIALWNVLRILSYVYICKQFRKHLKGVPDLRKRKKLLGFLALLFGAIVYKIYSMIVNKISEGIWNMKKLGSTDQFFV